jgi:calcium/calmodulin-dependent protein kinase I
MFLVGHEHVVDAADKNVQESLQNPWIAGKGATDHNLLPEIRAYMAKARLKRGIEIIKLANRIEQLKMQEDEEDDVPQAGDVPAGATQAAGELLANQSETPLEPGLAVPEDKGVTHKRSLSRIAKGAIFREVVLAKVREMKADEEAQKVTLTGSFDKDKEGK